MSETINILVVDDHPLVRRALVTQISEQPDLCVVAESEHAEQGLALAIEHQPDVIVMDIDMPGMQAFEAARILKTRCSDAHVVFLSAFARDHYIQQALDVEASGYVSKNEPPETILRAIRSAVAGRPYFSKAIRNRLVVTNASIQYAGSQSRLARLSNRELEVLRYIARGLAKKEIARVMHISEHTVNRHTDRLMDKLDLHDRVELARFAIREGLVEA